MAITRAKKEAQVQELAEELRSGKMTVFVSYKGMPVKQAEELRAEMKHNDGNFRVVKNAMFKLAAAQVFEDLDLSSIDGPIAVAVGYSDQVVPAKTIANHVKQYEVLQPLGAVNEFGQWLTAEEVERLATLPSRDQLTAQLVGTLAAPISGFVTVLEGNLRGLVTALDAVAQTRQENA